MLKKKIEYTNFNRVKTTAHILFHFGVPELMAMEMVEGEAISIRLTRLSEERDGAEVNKLIREFILDAYGIKSSDGEQFIKSPELRRQFEQSAAFEQLYLELSTDAAAASEFINAIMPAEAIKEAERRIEAQAAKAATPPSVEATLAEMGVPQSPAPWTPFAEQVPPPPPAFGPPPAPQP